MTEFICPPDHTHGENGSCYMTHKCRCDDCRRGRREYEYWRDHLRRMGRVRMVDATGTRRRLQALIALGWGSRAISVRCDRCPSWVTHVLNVPKVHVATAQLVERIYDEMSMTVPEPRGKFERAGVTKARKWARDHGWALPLQWDDDTIDDPTARPITAAQAKVEATVRWAERCDEAVIVQAIDGKPVKLAPLERREVIRRLWTRQWSDRKIAPHAQCTDRQVLRIRGELNLPAWDLHEMEMAA